LSVDDATWKNIVFRGKEKCDERWMRAVVFKVCLGKKKLPCTGGVVPKPKNVP
jgi:hypothetical protein